MGVPFRGSFPGVLTVLSGMTYMEHLQDNLRTYSPLDELTDDDKEFLEQTAQLMLRYPTIPCNDCKYCMPCPYGLDIPAILLHYNKCVNEGNVATSSQDENYRRRAGRSSWATTAASRNSARPAIASAVTSACRIARRISVSRRNCTASTGSPNISNRIAYRPSGPAARSGLRGSFFGCSPPGARRVSGFVAECRLRTSCIRFACRMPRARFCPGIPQQSLRR